MSDLRATSRYALALSRPQQDRVWASFLQHGTAHSARAATLPYVMCRCEQEGIAYVLRAVPGAGYFIENTTSKTVEEERDRLRGLLRRVRDEIDLFTEASSDLEKAVEAEFND